MYDKNSSAVAANPNFLPVQAGVEGGSGSDSENETLLDDEGMEALDGALGAHLRNLAASRMGTREAGEAELRFKFRAISLLEIFFRHRPLT